ncbi:hypothetical protein [Pseudotabrizicola sediminis]|uniref:hypothetical protein n=1 Tax=Pseudotabrizicola sediminis TaxID=2486418 RepID=UPI001081EEF9|nr:hypothetical protein [Pseudotabrizicola sediminis]
MTTPYLHGKYDPCPACEKRHEVQDTSPVIRDPIPCNICSGRGYLNCPKPKSHDAPALKPDAFTGPNLREGPHSMFKPLPTPRRAPQPAEIIVVTLAQLEAAARKHTPLGTLSKADRDGLIKRTASLCAVSVDRVIEVCGG